ncbi:hypothetical protein BC826DRAFT_1179379 [Russula brevipes]|nr:hypothetical protein BC826DRAFT_1179379 [Russula brevipes]
MAGWGWRGTVSETPEGEVLVVPSVDASRSGAIAGGRARHGVRRKWDDGRKSRWCLALARQPVLNAGDRFRDKGTETILIITMKVELKGVEAEKAVEELEDVKMTHAQLDLWRLLIRACRTIFVPQGASCQAGDWQAVARERMIPKGAFQYTSMIHSKSKPPFIAFPAKGFPVRLSRSFLSPPAPQVSKGVLFLWVTCVSTDARHDHFETSVTDIEKEHSEAREEEKMQQRGTSEVNKTATRNALVQMACEKGVRNAEAPRLRSESPAFDHVNGCIRP